MRIGVKMDLSKMCPKDKMRYEVAMEVKDDLIVKLIQDIIPEDFEEILYMISRAEYKRGKADGIAETQAVHIEKEDKNGI